MTDSYPCTSVWYAARVGGSSSALSAVQAMTPQRGGWHGTGTFGTQKGSFQMNTQNMRAGQFACGLLLHGGLYHRQRPAHGGQRLRPKGEQHIRYAVAQQDGQELGQSPGRRGSAGQPVRVLRPRQKNRPDPRHQWQ